MSWEPPDWDAHGTDDARFRFPRTDLPNNATVLESLLKASTQDELLQEDTRRARRALLVASGITLLALVSDTSPALQGWSPTFSDHSLVEPAAVVVLVYLYVTWNLLARRDENRHQIGKLKAFQEFKDDLTSEQASIGEFNRDPRSLV